MSTAGNNVEQDIVNAAQDIFVEKGYDGATMREIAARAGINISMLHYYFRSKDNLFDIVFNRVFQRLYGRIFEVMASSEDLFTKLKPSWNSTSRPSPKTLACPVSSSTKSTAAR